MNRDRRETIGRCRSAARFADGMRREIILSVLLTIYAFPVLSNSPVILLVQSGSASVYQQITSKILSSLETNCTECQRYRITQANIEDVQFDELLRAESSRLKLVVTIGVKAARLIAMSQLSTPRLYTLIPIASAASLNLNETSETASAIYLDQPFLRQLNLIKLISNARQVLGVVFGPATTASRGTLELAAESLGIPIRQETVNEEIAVGPALRRLLVESDVLLALPDPLVYNQNTIFNILLSSYHNQVPVIGFSASYVKAGAMLAVYSSPSDIGRHIAGTIRQFVMTGANALPGAEFPRYFSIEVNKNVARSLDIDLPTATELKQRLDRLERQ